MAHHHQGEGGGKVRAKVRAEAKAWAKITRPDHPGYASVQKLMSEKDGHTARTRDNRNEILDLGNPRKIDNFPKN